MRRSPQQTVAPCVRTVYLKLGTFGEEVLVKVQQGTLLRFKLASNLHGIQVNLFTNYHSDYFERNCYQEQEFSDQRFDEDTLSGITVIRPGSINYYFTTHGTPKACGGGWILVDPQLTVNNTRLSLDSISMITYMPKCLGKFTEWDGRLRVAIETGFNFIHFTPVQALGPSGSGYSIVSQLELNPDFGQLTWNELKLMLNKMRKEAGMLTLCDIVLNHTANESPWLQDHPESAYNLHNSPHLIPAYLLDRLLLKISFEVAHDKWTHRGIPSNLNAEHHLDNLRILLHEQIKLLRLEEFYFIGNVDCRLEYESPTKILHSYQRFGSKVGGNTPRWEVEKMNEDTRHMVNTHLNSAVENVLAGIRYERIQEDGPKYEKVTKQRPLAHRYFIEIKGLSETCAIESLFEILPNQPHFIMAHNGWVMNDDPLRNFADADSSVYLRRELIAWSDSVKLRYGHSSEASPFLWSFMRQYVELVADVFDGVRLDNCHSTPIHVAEYLIDAARTIKPELLVVAELFTNCDGKDNVFVNHLGINVLIRGNTNTNQLQHSMNERFYFSEAQQAWNSHEQGRLLFRYGGKPVGAFENTVPPPVANALFFDQTHDNPSPMEKRCLKDVLPTAALLAFGVFAVGSNRGYDDLVPYHIHVVNESRLYTTFVSHPKSPGEVNLDSGMFRARKCLNKIHAFLGQAGFCETYIDQLDEDVVSVTRGNPLSRQSMILVSYTAFSLPPDNFKRSPHSIRAIEVQGQVTRLVFEGRLILSSTQNYVPDAEFLTGVKCQQKWREDLPIEQSQTIEIFKGTKSTRVEFLNLQPGDVVALKVDPFPATKLALEKLSSYLTSTDLETLIKKLDLITLNYVLYRCCEEDDSVYNVPKYGTLIYAGLQGIASVLETVSFQNDLGHPICSNLREGKWLMDFIVNRFLKRDETKGLGHHVEKMFGSIGELPKYVVPTYFEQCFRRIYTLCVESALSRTFSSTRTELWRMLALSSVQFVGFAESGGLPGYDKRGTILYSMSAGLPHFSTGFMRSWGRDTFIALPGLLLLTGRHEEAKDHILSYGSVLRNGIIPNLLNEGNCRYNCRDATWWWLYAVLRYIDLVPNGAQILNSTLNFNGHLVELQDLIHLSIETHFRGIHFREGNAGKEIDAHMKEEGFNIDIYVDHQTGFILGGNPYNCGTWMDKMGSNDTTGNRGIPATPRDGGAVEIIGLSAAVLSRLSRMTEYRHKYVEDGDVRITYADWCAKIQQNFEPKFWIDPNSCEELANVRNIYKDSVGSSNGFGDFQLRPNFLVAMVVAPELFSKDKACLALEVVKAKLVSKLGLKTLDESDWNYNGDYYNSDSTHYGTSGGFNYHQGPEWLWPMGFYLRAQLLFNDSSAVAQTRQILSAHYEHMKGSDWRSLPELTNRNSEPCSASCPAQAWSCATIIEVLDDLEKLS